MDSSSYAQSSTPNAARMALGNLAAVAAVGRKPFTVGSGVAEYNLNKYNKVGAGHVNKNIDRAADMREFLSGVGQTIGGSSGAKELLTVAEEFGRKGAAIQLQTIIVDQVRDAKNSDHFRILRPRQMADAELKGISQTILKFQYTPPTEAPEFAPPHYLQFSSEIYEGQGYRFNNGIRFNPELLLTQDGHELLSQYTECAINNFIKLMEQIVTYTLIGAEDRYHHKKLLIDSGAQSIEELVQKFKYNDQTMGPSFLAYSGVPGILQRPDGFEMILNWAKKVTTAQNVNITHCLVVPDSLIGISLDRTDYSKRGPEAMDALYGGEEYTKSIIRRINGIEIIEQPTYEMQDARVKTDQALSNLMEIGQHYVLDMTPYSKLRAIQSARGIDSKAPRFGAAVNDLYYLDYSTEQITKKCQPFADLMHAALCWDENGELNDIIYRNLEDMDMLERFIENLELKVSDVKAFKPDPWVVLGPDGRFRRVEIVGNQDTYHTSVKSTQLAVDIAADMIKSKFESTAQHSYKKLLDLMKRNEMVKPDRTGDIEGFWVATSWANVDNRKLDDNEAIWTIPETKLPNLTEVYNDKGFQQGIFAYGRTDKDNNEVVCFKIPVVSTDEGPLFHHEIIESFINVMEDNTVAVADRDIILMSLAGYVLINDGSYYDIKSLLFCTETTTEDQKDLIELLFDFYTKNYGKSATVEAATYLLINDLTTELVGTEYGTVRYFNSSNLPSGIQFNTPESVVKRVDSVLLQAGVYGNINRAFPPSGTPMREQSRKAQQHPHYVWLDKKLVNDINGRGCFEDDKIKHDPTQFNDLSYEYPYINIVSHHSLWSIKMTALGFQLSNMFYTFQDLQKCVLLGQRKGFNQLPGVSTLASMKSIADQMSTSYISSGWSKVDDSGIIKTMIKGVHALEEVVDVCYRVFCPRKSSATSKHLPIGLCFDSEKFLHRDQLSGIAEEDAKKCFANMIFSSSQRLMALINPFIHYPLLLNQFSYKNLSADGARRLEDRHHLDVTFRFSDIGSPTLNTKFIVNVQSIEELRPVVFDTQYNSYIVVSAYNYLKGTENVSKPTKHIEYPILQSGPLAAKIATIPGIDVKQKYVQKQFYEHLIKYLIEKLPEHNMDILRYDPATSKLTTDFLEKFFELADQSQKEYLKFYSDIDDFFKALHHATHCEVEFFDYVFDNPNVPETDFSRFKCNHNELQNQANQWFAEVKTHEISERKSQFGQKLDKNSEKLFEGHEDNLHQRFKKQLYSDNSDGAEKLYTSTMLFSVHPQYWIDLDRQFKTLYNLKHDGIGIQFSLARTQTKHGFNFVDTVANPDGTGGKHAPSESKIEYYQELLDIANKGESHFNLNRLLMKFSHGSKFHHHHHHHGSHHHLSQMIVDRYNINSHFHERYHAIENDFVKKAVALAYLTAHPTADLMISLHDHGIPQPMVLIPTDPWMTFRMNSMLFVDASVNGSQEDPFLGYHLTFHTSGMDSDIRELREHFSTWIYPYFPRQEKVVQIPNVSFGGVVCGTSGRIIQSIAGVRDYGKHFNDGIDDHSEVDWDPANPYERRGDRFVNYGGGSLTDDKIGTVMNFVGNTSCAGSRMNCGVELPESLVPITPNNQMSQPSALVFNMATGYYDLNNKADEDALNPRCFYHIRANSAKGKTGGLWNVWSQRGPQWSVNYETGNGDIPRAKGCGPLANVNAGDAWYLKGLSRIFKNKGVSDD